MLPTQPQVLLFHTPITPARQSLRGQLWKPSRGQFSGTVDSAAPFITLRTVLAGRKYRDNPQLVGIQAGEVVTGRTDDARPTVVGPPPLPVVQRFERGGRRARGYGGWR